jgi:hypothetical protein
MANNSVDIYINGHERGILQAVERTKSAIAALRDSRITVTVDVDDGEIDALKAKLAGMRGGALDVEVNVNDAKLAALKGKIDALRNTRVKVTVDVDRTELNALKAELAGLRDRRVNVGVDSDIDAFRSALAATALGNANARINLDLDTATAAGELAAFIAAVPRNVTINLDVDTAGAAAEVAAFRVALLALNNDTINLGTNAGSTASGIGRMGSAGGAAAPLLAGLTVALAPLISGAAGTGVFATAAGLGAVTAAAGALSVGVGGALAGIPIVAAATSQKVQDSFTFMKDDVVNTMKEIAEPVQQPLVDLATSVGAAFHSIRPSLDVVTAGAARLVDELSGEMPAIAAEIGPAMEKAFGAAEPHIKNLISNVPSYIEAFGDFTEKLGDPAIVAGAQRVFGMVPEIIDGAGDSIVSMANGFENVMGFLDEGRLDGFTSGIGSFISEMGNTDWSGTVSGIADMSNAFGDLMGSIEGDSVSGFLEGVTGDITKFTEAATAVGEVGDTIGDVLTGIGEKAESLNLGEKIFGEGWDPNRWLNDHAGFLGDFEEKVPDTIPAPKVEPIDTTPFSTAFDQLPVPPVIPAPEITPPDTSVISGALANIAPPGAIPAPEVTPPDTSAISGALANITPPTIPAPIVPAPEVTPGPPIPAPEVLPPPPVTVEVQAVEGEAITVPPPAPVPITFDVTQPTIVLNPPPPVPITFNVSLPTINIPAPAPVMIPVQIDASAANVDLSSQGANAGQSFARGLAGSAGAVAAAAAGMAAAARGVSVDLSGAGAAAGASFASGLRSQSGAVAAAAAELGAVAAANKGVYKGRKGIAADRIMLIPHGQAMVAGFIDGLGSQRRELVTEASSLAKAVTKRFDEELVPNIGLSGGVGVQQQVFVTVEAGLMADPVKIGREIKDAVGAYVSAVGGSETISVG